MCLVGCDVRIRTAQPGGSGVCGRPGHHRRNSEQKPAGDRFWGETDIAGRTRQGAKESSAVYRTRGHGTNGVRSPGTDNCGTDTDQGPADTAVPASKVRSFNDRTTVRDVQTGSGDGQENSECGRKRQRATTGVGRYDTGHTTLKGRSQSI